MSEQTKRLYEAMFLVDSAVATANWEGVTGAIQTVFDRANADVVSVRKWDEMRLSYPIKHCTRGTYILSYFRADPSVISGLERDVKLNDTFLRVLVLQGEHLSEDRIAASTPAMKASEAAKQREEAAAKAEAAKAAKATADAETLAKETSIAVAEPEEGEGEDPKPQEAASAQVEPFDELPEVEGDEPKDEPKDE